MTWTNTVFFSAVLCLLSLGAQLIAFRKNDQMGRFMPVILLAVLHVCNLAYYLSGLGAYDYNDLISHKEVISLMNAVLLGSAVIGNIAAWTVRWIIHTMKKHKNGRTLS